MNKGITKDTSHEPSIPADDVEEPAPVPVRPNSPTNKTPAGDARGSKEKMKQNRDHLRVNEEHKTPEMEKGHRGTFP